MYNSDKIERIWDKIEEENFNDNEITIVAGDFNIRIGEEGGCRENGDLGYDAKRKSKDKTISNGGRNFVNYMEDKGWSILNGSIEGDWEGEYTFMYYYVNEKAWDIVENLR